MTGDLGPIILDIECDPVFPLYGGDVELTCKFTELPRQLRNMTAGNIPSDVLEGLTVSRTVS